MAERRTGTASEQPTAERRRQARRRGEVATSADLTGALALAATVAVLAIAGPTGVARLLRYFGGALGQATLAAGAHAKDAGEATGALGAAGRAAFAVVMPLVLVPCAAVLLATVAFGAAQTAGLFSWSAARPAWARVSPRAGLGRLFGLESLAATGRAVFKVVLVIAIAAPVLTPLVAALPGLVRGNATTIVIAMGQLSLHLAARLIVALCAWGIVDWTLARWRHQRSLAMSRDEVRREQREREGDPRHRAERRRVHGALAQQEAPEDSRAADFVVVGAGPIAVAVAYDRAGGRAPVIVVTGRGAAAERMVSTAHAAAVVVHRDDALARALIDTPAAEEIPASCFEAVAVLLP